MKTIHVVGARPQFVKAAMVSRALKNRGEEFILHTGQHYSENMSRLFFSELKLPEPDINLEIGSGSHAEQTSGMLLGIDRYLETVQPDWMIVYGDTNSTLAGALAPPSVKFPSPMWKPGCAPSIVPCRKRSTGWSAITFPPYCSAPPIRRLKIWHRKALPGESTRWAM
jgi:hypothetical protein